MLGNPATVIATGALVTGLFCAVAELTLQVTLYVLAALKVIFVACAVLLKI